MTPLESLFSPERHGQIYHHYLSIPIFFWDNMVAKHKQIFSSPTPSFMLLFQSSSLISSGRLTRALLFYHIPWPSVRISCIVISMAGT